VGRLRFGLEVSSGFDQAGAPMRDRYLQVLRQVRLARELGFDGIFCGQYYVRDPAPFLQPWPLLAGVAHEAGDMNLGTGVLLLSLLHPIDVAEQAATVDIISNGHFVLGVGGAYGEELEHFGIDRKTRGKRVEEMIDVIRLLWEGEPFSYDGQHFQLRNVTPTLLPVQRPGPQIWIGASADVVVRRAGRIADSCLFGPHSALETLERQGRLFLETYAEHHDGARPPAHSLMRETFVAEDRDTAWATARPYLERQYQELYVEHGQDKELPPEDRFDLPFDDLARDRFAVGDPADVAADLERYVDLGFDYFVLQPPWFGVSPEANEECIRLLGTEVMPKLQAYAGA
jgi:alkanesulfonate monooxygenase SsuD/methylene tetrahydromethanopterin reductase-like flavin-dependent oxidoreductase (luciferase family)